MCAVAGAYVLRLWGLGGERSAIKSTFICNKWRKDIGSVEEDGRKIICSL